MGLSGVKILQHSSTVRPYALFELFNEKKIPLQICTFVPTLHALGWNEPEEEGPLVLLGGPQSVYDKEGNPWLSKEIAYVQKCINKGHKVLGICLGAQILAEILGAQVQRSPEAEVGWYPIQIRPEACSIGLKAETINFFQWHFDRFDTPKEATALFSGADPNTHQGFIWKEQVLAIQFHPEMTHDGALLLCNRAGIPMGTQLHSSPCKESDFKKYSPEALSNLKKNSRLVCKLALTFNSFD